MFLLVKWVGADKDVAGMGIAVDEPRYKDLFGEGSDDVVHDLFFVEIEML
jgi:hypothetical protein